MSTAGFYKLDSSEVLFGPNYVLNQAYTLHKDSHQQNTYPVDGWYWFDSIEEAYSFFGLQYPPPEQS